MECASMDKSSKTSDKMRPILQAMERSVESARRRRLQGDERDLMRAARPAPGSAGGTSTMIGRGSQHDGAMPNAPPTPLPFQPLRAVSPALPTSPGAGGVGHGMTAGSSAPIRPKARPKRPVSNR
jgi:hypothetical protein